MHAKHMPKWSLEALYELYTFICHIYLNNDISFPLSLHIFW